MLLPANRGNWELGLGIAGRCHRGGSIQPDGRDVVVARPRGLIFWVGRLTRSWQAVRLTGLAGQADGRRIQKLGGSMLFTG